MKFKLNDFFKGEKAIKIAVAIGIILIIFIAFSGTFTKDNQEVSEDTTTATYKDELQKEITSLISKIDGVGEASVMITLKSDSEYIYAKEEKQNSDTTGSVEEQEILKQSDNYENSTILVEDHNGRKQALVKTRLEPKIRGVLVVCTGGNDPEVEAKVTQAVKTVLGIGANNVCVTN